MVVAIASSICSKGCYIMTMEERELGFSKEDAEKSKSRMRPHRGEQDS